MNAFRLPRSLIQCVAVFALSLASAVAVAAAGPLDGKVFVGEAGVKGKPADEKNDIITFANGKFHSSACDQWGFNKADYTTRVEGDVTVFEVETVSETDGRLKWTGRLVGSVLEGTFVHHRKPAWYRPKPEPIEHWFKAVPKP